MYRNHDWILSSVDDFLMQVMGMSQAIYGDGWIVGRNAYNNYRPEGWPKIETVMPKYGFPPNLNGWKEFVALHIGLPVMNRKELQRRRPQNHQSWCKVCGRIDKNYRIGMCAACYRYWRLYGKKRPRYLWDSDLRCKNCGIPLSALGTYKSGEKLCRKGQCITCYNYASRWGKPRPKRLWLDGPYGFCECGYPAVALVEDIPVCVRHRE
jgi:hypothetical protein